MFIKFGQNRLSKALKRLSRLKPSKKNFLKSGAVDSKTFCVMPWTNLATETNGKCKICCIVMTNRYIKNAKGEDFHIQKDAIEDIWNSQYVRQVREKMVSGKQVEDCSYCYGREDLGQVSPRQSYNEMWLTAEVKERVKESQDKGGYVDGYPTSLEPRPGILCNLKCNMCWSLSSSKIYSERKEALKNKEEVPGFLVENWLSEVEWADNSDFGWSESSKYLSNLEKCLPTLNRLYFTGGEPTLIKSNLAVLKRLIEIGHTGLLVSFTTNLQQLKDEWLEVLLKFERVEITGSIDGFGPVNDYIRYPSQWKNIELNMLRILALPPRISFSIIFVVQAANIFSFVDLVRWVSYEFKQHQILVMPTMLQGPPFLRPQILQSEVLTKALYAIDEALKDNQISSRNKAYLAEVRSQILAVSPGSKRLQMQFFEYMTYLDRTRKTDFRSVFPELSMMSQNVLNKVHNIEAEKS